MYYLLYFNMNSVISISPKFQITIPKYIRDQFPDIKPSGKVVFKLDKKNNQIIIKPQKYLKDLVGFLPIKVKSTPKDFGKIREIVAKERTKDLKKKYGKIP